MNRLKLVFCVCLILAFLSGCAAQTDSSPEVPKPEDTHWLWVEGKKLASGPDWNGVSYCKLSELAACCGGSFDDGPDLTLTAWEHTLRFKRGTGTVSADGITVHLDVPCLCYEGEWYAPAAELMTLLGLDELEDPELKKLVPAGRFGKPEEVAALVGFLVSDEAAYITGEVININGGLYT